MAREKTPVKTLAYLTTDEVNEATVARMASAYGAIVVPFYPKDEPRSARFDAMLYDFDCLPTERGRKLILELLSAPNDKPVVFLIDHHEVVDSRKYRVDRQHLATFQCLKTRLNGPRSALTGARTC